MAEDFPNFLRAWRLKRGMTLDQVADAAGTGKTQISKLEMGQRRLTMDWLKRIARALSCNPADLMMDPDRVIGQEAAEDAVPYAAAEMETRSVRADVGENDFPVYSAVEAGPGEIEFSAEPIEWVKRPEPLFRISRGFGLIVVGTSMEEAYREGDMVLVHPTLPLRTEEDVVFTKADIHIGGVRAMLKRLVRWDDRSWTVRQFNPPKTWKVKREDWPYVFMTVGKYSRRR